ncbi:SURF1 family protein [Rhizohabitans arisaemae]|uniref:SURF1 family protein n=1 Tax=Rhizohabitans arisaemae TaxID=2720610 RepID=UPI0024B0C050|nr:SURF1 family protein [Rhizohabitans arisaemae]
MLRTLFSPRLFALHAVTIGLLVVFVMFGIWQMGEFEESGRPRAAADPAPVAVARLSAPGEPLHSESIARQVTAEGEFEAARQLLVPGRYEDGKKGFWLLAPLRMDDRTTIPVVRGWIATADDPAVAVPSGRVQVVGRLRASEPTDAVPRRDQILPAGQVATVSTGELVNLWPGVRLREGYVVQTSGSAAVPVTVAPPTMPTEFDWRNLAYAAQWWIFGAFGVFMWFHFVRDAVRGAAKSERGAAPA